MAQLVQRTALFLATMILGMIAPFWVFLLFAGLVVLLVPRVIEIVLLVMCIEYVGSGFQTGYIWIGYFAVVTIVELLKEKISIYAT